MTVKHTNAKPIVKDQIVALSTLSEENRMTNLAALLSSNLFNMNMLREIYRSNNEKYNPDSERYDDTVDLCNHINVTII